MRIALLSARSGYIFRGVENWSYELKKRLSGEVEVFSLFETDWTTRVKGIKRIDAIYKYCQALETILRALRLHKFCKYIPYFDINSTNNLEEISFAFNLCGPLQKFKPDIIINHSGSNVGMLLRFYRYKYKTPFIAVGGAGKGPIELKNAQTKPDCYVAQTPSMEEFIKTEVPEVKVGLIPNGIDLDFFDPSGKKFSDEELRAMSGTKDAVIEHPLILSTSALIESKRLDFLIQAVSLLKKGTLIFTSDGEAREKLLSLAREKLGRRFIYLGVLPYEDFPCIYRTCDVFCLPSFDEPFGNVFIEAMAANCPVVAHKDSDRTWMISEDAGILTDASDVNGLAYSLKVASERDWGISPRENAKRFSWDTITGRYMDLINEVLPRYQKATAVKP